MSEEQDRKDYEEYVAFVKRQRAFQRQKASGEFDKKYDPTEGMSGGAKFLAGVGSGLTDVGRKATNLALPKSLEPKWASKEAIAQQGATDEALLNTGAGLAGNFAGSAIATAPVGMGAGAALGAGARGLATMSNVPRLTRALEAAGNVGRLGGRVAQGAAQGGVEGALLASPDQRMGGAAAGGALGGAIPLVGAAVGKVGKFLGKDRRTEDARALQKIMDKTSDELDYKGADRPMIPASQSLEPGVLKQVYEGFVSNIPGGSGPLREQYGQAMGGLRESAIRAAAPDRTVLSSTFQHGDDFQQSLGLLKKEWDDAFDTVNSKSMSVPADFFPDSLKKQLGEYEIRLPTGNVTGKELTTAKTQIQALIDELPSGPLGQAARTRLMSQKSRIDDLIKNQLPADEAAQWTDDLKKYKNFEDLMSAAKTAPGTSEFTPKALAAQTSKRAGRKGLFGEGGPLQELGRLGQTALKDFPSRQGVFQTLAATGAAQGIAGGITGNEGLMGSGLGTVLLPILAAKGLSNRAVQRKLTEGLSSPKAAEKFIEENLKNHPQAADAIRRYFTQAGVAGLDQE